MTDPLVEIAKISERVEARRDAPVTERAAFGVEAYLRLREIRRDPDTSPEAAIQATAVSRDVLVELLDVTPKAAETLTSTHPRKDLP